MTDPPSEVEASEVKTHALIVGVKLDNDADYVIDMLVGGQPDTICMPRAGTHWSFPRQLRRCQELAIMVPYSYTQDERGRHVELEVERFANSVDRVLDEVENTADYLRLACSNAETALMFSRMAAQSPLNVARVGVEALNVHLIRRLLG